MIPQMTQKLSTIICCTHTKGRIILVTFHQEFKILWHYLYLLTTAVFYGLEQQWIHKMCS